MEPEQELTNRLSGLPDFLKAKIILALGEPTAPSPVNSSSKAIQPQHQLTDPSELTTALGHEDGRCTVDLRHLQHTGFTVADGYLSPRQVIDVLDCAQQALAEQQRQAGMGGSLVSWKDPQIRGDVSRWLHVEEEQQAGRAAMVQVLNKLTQLRQALLTQGFDVGGKTTFQLACYPGNGARYVRHTDRSQSAPTRRVTALLYLNLEWDVQTHGGQLALYLPAGSSQTPALGWQSGEPALLVAPMGGRLLILDSLLEHEVLPAQHSRWAIAAWFHCSKPAAMQADPNAMPHHSHSVPYAHTEPSNAPHNRDSVNNVPTKVQVPGLSATPCVGLPRIFVSVAAYRDPEAQWTILDLFAKAASPQRVRIGIVWQVDAVEDAGFTAALPSQATLLQHCLHQVREVRIPAAEATGPCKARALAASLWAGEEYYLQIDSHMRFVQGWDQICIEQLLRTERLLQCGTITNPLAPADDTTGSTVCASADDTTGSTVCASAGATVPANAGQQQQRRARGAVLTTYPPDYLGNGAEAAVVDSTQTTLLCAAGFDEQGMLRTRGRLLATDWKHTLQQHLQQQHDMDDTRAPDGTVQEQALAVAQPSQCSTQQSQQRQPDRACGSAALAHTSAQRPTLPAPPPPQQQQGHGPATHSWQGTKCCAHGHGHRMLLQHRQAQDPLPCVGWAAGFSFGRAAALVEHAAYPPPDELPFLFMGEETYQYARLWTHGYDCFSPGRAVCFHQWARSSRAHTLCKDAVSEIEYSQRASMKSSSQRKVLAVLKTALHSPAHNSADPASMTAPGGTTKAVTATTTKVDTATTTKTDTATITKVDTGETSKADTGETIADTPGETTAHTLARTAMVQAAQNKQAGHEQELLPAEWELGRRWGLGMQRPLQDLEQHVGLDLLAARVCDEGAKSCWLPPAAFQA